MKRLNCLEITVTDWIVIDLDICRARHFVLEVDVLFEMKRC